MDVHLMPTKASRGGRWIGRLAIILAVGLPPVSNADTVNLSAQPPEVSISVAPNLVLTFDDSGSMNWHHSPDQRPYTDAGWNTASDTDQDALANITYRAQAGPYLCAGVITPGITDPGDPRAWSMNGIYFNPDHAYAPPLLADGSTAMPNSTYTAAWDNGIQINRPVSPVAIQISGINQNTRDLGRATLCGNIGAGYYKYTGTRASLPLDANGQLNAMAVAVLYTSDNWTWVSLSSAAEQQNFANWYSYYRSRTMAAITAIARAFAPFDKNMRVAWQSINAGNLTNSTAIYKFVDHPTTHDVRTRFYNWLFAMTASGATPNRSAAKRAGMYFTHRTGAVDENPYWDRDADKELVCRQNFHVQITDGMWSRDDPMSLGGSDTTNIAALPDGRAFSTSDRESAVIWNEPGNSIVTMADLAFHDWSSDLQAEVTGSSLFAMQANRRKVAPYITDTSTDLFNLPLAADSDPRDNREIYWNPANDPASWPHLVQYMIGFGAPGALANNSTTYAGLRKGDTKWPALQGPDDSKRINDMWHAALNSRGQFFAAGSPSDLTAALNRIINSIAARSATAVAGSLSSSVLGPTTVLYTAGYDSRDWTGRLVANRLDAGGAIAPAVLWNGRDLLDNRANAEDARVILTSIGTGSDHAAAFNGISVVNAINAVDVAFGSATTKPTGNDRLDWLRGTRTREGSSFRQRDHVLGAVMNAQALYVAKPASGYRDNWPANSRESLAAKAGNGYQRFQQDHARRAPTVYVGANDGMLHAFDATTIDTPANSVDVLPSPGRERWAYVPYSVYGRLSQWSSLKSFNFTPSVDGAPVSRDVYFGSGSRQGWRTILVAGLRYGGRGVYALDITSSEADQTRPSDKVLWEFNNTSAGGANLGYTFGRPNVGRLASGQWVVLVPGGYFPSEMAVDCSKAGNSINPVCNKFSSLFVLDAQSGALLKEIKTPTSGFNGLSGDVESYGMGTPVLGDYEGNQIEGVAFAGDLEGNVWRFDLSGDSTQWKAELFFRPSSPGDRPVTVMPRLFPDPVGGGLIVIFGTGKYLAGSDNVIDSSTQQQAVYGIRDSGSAGQVVVVEGAASTPLVEQTMIERDEVRGLTHHAVPVRAAPVGNLAGTPIRGWFFKLYVADTTSNGQVNKGERVVVDAAGLFDTNRAIITSLIPRGSDPCEPASRGAVMLVDAATGGAADGVNVGSVGNWPDAYEQVGGLVKNPPTGGSLPVAVAVGGGQIYLPGLTRQRDGKVFSAGAPIWRRRSWRVLNDDL